MMADFLIGVGVFLICLVLVAGCIVFSVWIAKR